MRDDYSEDDLGYSVFAQQKDLEIIDTLNFFL